MSNDDIKLAVVNSVENALKNLTAREEKTLRLRFGIDDGKQRSLEEVGKIFDVTRERIRQIEVKGIKKLCFDDNMVKLSDYICIDSESKDDRR